MVNTLKLPIDEFIGLATSKIDDLTAHLISPKVSPPTPQIQKNNLPANTAILLVGCAEK